MTEIERKISIAFKRVPVRFFCARCDAAAEMLSINEAANRTGKPWREIVGLIESGELHSTETDAGGIYVCAESISKKIRERKNETTK